MRPGGRADHPIELLSASIDRELRPAEAAALEMHLEGCAECRGLLGDFRNLDEAIASEPPPPVAAGLEDRILEALRSRGAVRPRRLWWRAMPAAAAASLVVAIAVWFARPDRLPPLSGNAAPPAMSGASSVPSSAAPAAAPALPDAPESEPAPAVPPVAPAAPAPSHDDLVRLMVDAEKAAAKDSAPSRPSQVLRREADAAAIEPARESAAAGSTEGKWTVATPAEPKPDADAERQRMNRAIAAQTSDLAARTSEASLPPANVVAPGRTGQPEAGAAAGPQAASLPAPRHVGVFARPYVVTLESGSLMQVHRGTYNCTVPIEESDGKVVVAAVNEILGAPEAAPRSMALESAAATVVTATPRARESILRLVRETYRPVLESRCGPLPN